MLEIHNGITKNIKNIEIFMRINKIMKIFKKIQENYANHENLINPFENN